MSSTGPTSQPSAELTAETYAPGQILAGRYRVVRALGEGGMGQVYECEHVEVGRRLALKVLQPWLATHEVAARFRTEARAASAAGHPNIVDVFDAGDLADGRPFIAMEFLDGEELLTAIGRASGLSLTRTLAIGSAVARALHAAHEVGIIHRDLKPENVMLVQRDGAEVVKVVDFGIAFEAAPERTTQAGIAVGTPEYMAPEQARGEPGNPRFDVYALGVLLFEMLSAKLPYQGRTALELLEKKSSEPPRSLLEEVPDAPQALVDLVSSCLDPEPERRPSTAAAVAQALDALSADTGAPSRGATPTAILSATTQVRAPFRWGVPIALFVAVTVGVVAFVLLRPTSQRVQTSWAGLAYVVSAQARIVPEPPKPAPPEPEQAPLDVSPPRSAEPGPPPAAAVSPKKTRATPRALPSVEPVPAPSPVPARRPSATECDGVERAGREARKKHLWKPMMDALAKAECWSDRAERRKLRVLGLKEQGRFEACAAAAKGIEDGEVRKWAAVCQKRAQK